VNVVTPAAVTVSTAAAATAAATAAEAVVAAAWGSRSSRHGTSTRSAAAAADALPVLSGRCQRCPQPLLQLSHLLGRGASLSLEGARKRQNPLLGARALPRHTPLRPCQVARALGLHAHELAPRVLFGRRTRPCPGVFPPRALALECTAQRTARAFAVRLQPRTLRRRCSCRSRYFLGVRRGVALAPGLFGCRVGARRRQCARRFRAGPPRSCELLPNPAQRSHLRHGELGLFALLLE
jgi:hypothetical protein